MLIEIRCDKFMDNGVVRPPIRFHQGLNTIMGASRASNSIGKTTFLLIIDFVFGGRDYVMLNDNDVVKNVGEHVIKFAFQFEKTYYFSRSTTDLNYVVPCDENYEPLPGGKLSLEIYCKFLAKKYGMDKLQTTFRDIVSWFYRIYGRNNYEERHPLRAHGNDTMEAGIRRLLQLYDMYDEIGELTDLYNAAIEEETTYKNAFKYDLIRGVTKKTDYEENAKQIEKLTGVKETLANKSSRGLLDLDSIQAERLSSLKKELAKYTRLRGRFRSQLRAMESDLDMDVSAFKRDYTELLEFFPDADIKHIEDIDRFHRQLKTVMKSQFKDSANKIKGSIELLNIQIERLEAEIKKIDSEPHLTKAVLDDYAGVDREIKNLEQANEYYEKTTSLHQNSTDLLERLNKLVDEKTADLQDEINTGLKELNRKVCGPKVSAPRLRINNAKTYTYTIKNDTGTGSQTRGMLLFDLLMLQETALPAIIEDSMSLKQVEDAVILKIFDLFNSCKKQVFVTIDKGESYSQDHQSVPEIFTKTTVLELYPGHELFGRAWNIETN